MMMMELCKSEYIKQTATEKFFKLKVLLLFSHVPRSSICPSICVPQNNLWDGSSPCSACLFVGSLIFESEQLVTPALTRLEHCRLLMEHFVRTATVCHMKSGSSEESGFDRCFCRCQQKKNQTHHKDVGRNIKTHATIGVEGYPESKQLNPFFDLLADLSEWIRTKR